MIGLGLTPKQVNDYYNQNMLYVQDEVQYLLKDYWASPQETKKSMAGDCEDFAIVKFFDLLDYHPKLAMVTSPDTGMHMVCLCNGYALDNLCDEMKLLEDTPYKVYYTFDQKYIYGSTGKSPNTIGQFNRILSEMGLTTSILEKT